MAGNTRYFHGHNEWRRIHENIDEMMLGDSNSNKSEFFGELGLFKHICIQLGRWVTGIRIVARKEVTELHDTFLSQ